MRTPSSLTPLASCLATALALSSPIAAAVNRTVTNCNDSGAGSLRSAVASAANAGDAVVFDTVQMACSTITLTSGQIAVDAEQLTIQGPIASTLTVGGFHTSRVFYDYGDRNRKLTINNLTVANGTEDVLASNFLVQGGCVLTSGDLILNNSTVTGCLVNNQGTPGFAAGGAVASYQLHMQNSVISDSYAHAYSNVLGGGVFVQDEALVRSSTITGNQARTSKVPGAAVGGGLGSQSVFAGIENIQVISSTISDNESDFGGGMGILYGPTVVIDHSTISGNRAHRYSGGVHLYADPASPNLTTTIVDSTISSNNSYSLVGGIYNNGTLSISNSTIAFNHAASGVFNVTYAMAAGLCTTVATLQSSIIAQNTVGASTESDLNGVFGETMSGSTNLIMTTLAGTTAPPGTLTSDPLLVALTGNGGPTQTHGLLVGSPAIGTGNNPLRLPSDQRGPGFARSTAGKTDIGAFQIGDGVFYGGFE